MANFLYNGVELPDINTVWTDKTAYPYAIITSFDAALVGYSGSSTIYLLDASGVAHYNNNGVCYKNPPYLSCSWFCSYDPNVCSYLSGMGLPITVGEWGGSSPSDIGSGSAQSVVGTVFWSNADILNTDGSVYFAASEPVPVGGSSGDDNGDDETGSGHYGMVEGAIHEIIGGTARVNGAGCEIADGRARTGGAWYELNFSGNQSGEGGDVGGDDTELNTGVLFEGGIAAAPIQYQVVNTSNALVNISPTAGIEDDYIFTNCVQGQILAGQTVVYPPIPIVAQIGPVDLSGFSTLHMMVSASGSVILGYGNTLATANSPNLTDYVTSPNVDINTKVELTVDIGSVSGEQYIKFYAANPNTTARAYKIWLT